MSTTSKKTDPKATASEKPKRTRKAAAPKAKAAEATETAPQKTAGEGTTTVAEATKEATTKENPASTTRANDPNREGAAGATDAASAAPEHNDEQARGNRHSHPAETEAERAVRLSSGAGEAATAGLASQAMPAGEDADPAKQPAPGSESEAPESRHDESGAIQDATRKAIGAGNGAPDGVGDDGADPSESEVNDLADQKAGESKTEEVAPGFRIGGGKLRLWRALEKGATRKELLEASGYRSVDGTVAVLAQYSGRGIDRTETATGEYVYKLKPLPDQKG